MDTVDDGRASARGMALGSVGHALAPLIGRERELERLRGSVASMLAGQGHVALLAGEPGIGKTRLTAELAAYACARSQRPSNALSSGELPTFSPGHVPLAGFEMP